MDEDRLLGNKNEMLTMSTVPHSTCFTHMLSCFTHMLSMAVIPLCGCVGRYNDGVN